MNVNLRREASSTCDLVRRYKFYGAADSVKIFIRVDLRDNDLCGHIPTTNFSDCGIKCNTVAFFNESISLGVLLATCARTEFMSMCDDQVITFKSPGASVTTIVKQVQDFIGTRNTLGYVDQAMDTVRCRSICAESLNIVVVEQESEVDAVEIHDISADTDFGTDIWRNLISGGLAKE